jgi:amidase
MMTRRALLASTAAATALAATTIDLPAATSPVRRSSVPPFDLDELTIAELSAGLRDGRWTSLDLVEKYLARIAMIDRDGPRLGSIIEVNPEAIGIARRLDEERSAGKVRGPLHGIPIVIKDNIDTADAMSTTAGSLALAGDRPSSDAPIVTKLREAGAILLAKTNLSEWANFRSTRSTSGWSARGGFTRNPYVLDRNSSGSST